MADLYEGLELAPQPTQAAPKAPPSMYDGLELAPSQPAYQPKPASGAVESIQAGFQASAPGLAWRRKLPDLITDPEHSSWWERALTGITQVGAELPIMAVGGGLGGAAGAAAGTAVAPVAGTAVGTVLGTGAGMFGLPAAIRETLIQSYKSGEIKTADQFWGILREVATTTAKEAAIGAATMGAGGIAARSVGSAIAPSIGTALSVPTAVKAIGAADVAAQIGTMVTIPAALQGRIPDAQEFLDAAIVIGGLKLAHPVAERITNTFLKTGKTPAEQVADAQANPEVAADLTRAEPAAVNPEMGPRAQAMADARLTELQMKSESTPLTDAERAERVFLANNKANPEKLADYYHLTPDLAGERLPRSSVDIQDSAQRVYADVLEQLKAVDQARRDAGTTELGDDHALAVAALVRARVVARATRLGVLPEDVYVERPLQIRDEAQAAVEASKPPEGAPTFTPPEVDLFGNPVEPQVTPRMGVENFATQEVPLANLVLSKEVPQFKHAANEEGVIVPLGGRFDRTGVGPIQVWERADGTLEVISGRHRLDLAKRTGETTIPAQIHREADGFTARMAATLDAQLNIREEQGNVADYAQYFKDAGITKEAADELGLLARAKGRAGFAIARDASPDLAAAHRAGLLSDEAALSISAAAPGSERLQALGVAMVNEGKSALVAVNTMKAVELMASEKLASGKQGDIFGFDDSAMQEAAAMAKKATSIQRKISEQISAVSGASRRPELARKMGVDVADPEGIQKKIKELKQEQYLWDNWPIHPELVAQLRGTAVEPKASPPAKYSKEIQAKLDAAKAEHDSHVEMIKKSDLGDQGARLKGEGMRYAAEKRQITGELTTKEQAAKDAREAGNYIGKEVTVDGFDAVVMGNPFGKVTVKFEDGQERTVEKDAVKPRKLDQAPVDDGILHQAETPAEAAARDREAAEQALRKGAPPDDNKLFQSDDRTVEVDGVRHPITNSDGRHIALAVPEQIAFWRWFGDSKVVDVEGKPLVVYHGTDEDFTTFKYTNDIGFHFGTKEQADTKGQAERAYHGDLVLQGENIMPVYLKIENPLRVDDLHTWDPDEVLAQLVRSKIITAEQALTEEGNEIGREYVADALRAKGYDGMVYFNETEGRGDSYIVFDPTQIKSATGNRGTFDPNDHNILNQSEGGLDSGKPNGRRIAGENFFGREMQTMLPLEVVHAGVVNIAHNNQVQRAVVTALPVDVVNMLKSIDLSPDDLFSDKAVSAGAALLRADPFIRVEILSGLGEALGQTEALLRAKLVDALSARGAQELIPTLFAGDLSRAEVRSLLTGSAVDLGPKSSAGSPELRRTGTGAALTNAAGAGTELSGADRARIADSFSRANLGAPAGARGLVGGDVVSDPARLAALLNAHAKIITDNARTDNEAKREALFQQRQSENRGSYDIAENLITTLAGADRSTVIHELGHSWLEEMKADAARKDAPAQIKADWDILRRELAIPESGTIERTSHEQFARTIERYVMEGEAPSAALKSVFERFKTWLLDIYKSVMNLNVTINPELRGVLDRMLATDQEIADARELGVPRAYVAEAKAAEAVKIVPPPELRKKIEPGFEAEQASMIAFADELPPGPGEAPDNTHVNYKYMNSAMDVKLATQRMAEIDQANIQKARGGDGGVKSWEASNAEQAQHVANMLGGDPAQLDKFINSMLGKDPDQQRVDVLLGIMKKATTGAAKDSARLRDVVLAAGHDATIRQQLEYMGSLERLRMIQAEYLGQRAAVARALNALKDTTEGSGEITRMLDEIGTGKLFQSERTPEQEQAYLKEKLDEIMLNYRGKSVLDIARLHKEIGTLKGSVKFADEVTKATKWEMLIEGWRAGLLSGPVTHTTNLFGTEAFFSLRPVVDTLGAIIGMARGASPGMGESDRASLSEGVARITGMLSGIKEGVKVGYHTFLADESTGKTETYREAIPGRFGYWMRTPLRMMGAADAINTTMYTRGEMKGLALRTAFDENLNPGTREFADRVDHLMEHPTPEMQSAAAEAATRMTFNMPLGEKGVALQNFVAKWNLQWMIPFIRTPINIFKELARMSPFSPIVGEWRADIAKGGVARDRALAEMALGTGIMAITIAYAFSTDEKGRKRLTGAGSPDAGKNRGKVGVEQPYSWLVGDTYYEYARIAPTGTLIGLSADVAGVWDHMDDEEKDKIPKMLAVAFSNAVTNQTFLQGITNFVNATSEPTRFAPRFLQQLAASTVPNIIGQPTAMADPVVRQVNSALEAVMARIPGLRQELAPKVDWLGEDVKTKERAGVIGPSRTMEVSEDKVRLEAARLEISLADAPKKTHIGKGTGKLGDVELTPEERTTFAKAGGEMAHKILTDIVSAPGYDAIPDLLKKRIFSRVLSASHRVAAVAALPLEKRQAYLQEITEKVATALNVEEAAQ